MSTSLLQELGIDKLSRDQRIELVQEIWESIASEQSSAPLLTDAQRGELERRIADAEAHPENAIPWEEVKASLQKRFKS